MATTALAGTMFATIDGKAYSVTGEGVYRPNAGKRESLTGQDGYHGYSEMPQPGKMSWKGRDSSAVAISALSNAAGVTVTFQLANGKLIVGRNMVRIGEAGIEVNTEDGSFDVDFEGPEVTEN